MTSAHGTSPRIVIDTNLLVAVLFAPQARGPRRVVDRWRRGEVRVCVSPAVRSEFEGTLGRLPVEAARRNGVLDLLEDPVSTLAIHDVPDSGWRCADPSDDKFLHLALAAGASALLTSDRALLAVRDFPIPILKSGQWLSGERR